MGSAWLGGVSGRPAGVSETLPDAYGALKFLAEQQHIDATRIGIMGFSWGDVVTMLTATQPYTSRYMDGKLKFAGHVAHYPVCWAYNRVPGYEFRSFTGSPVLIQAGELDAYDDPDICPPLVQSLTSTDQTSISPKRYRNATHAWDRLQPAITVTVTVTVTDPFSQKDRGGQVEMVPNPVYAFIARAKAVRFFQKTFGLAERYNDEAKAD
ncbi:dienelactone hydrolase family protein [Chitinimonas sp. BJB300]|uniref:dienelactone hydrolase family protein n=1 Tax=Chitinimonas sp. BJB300 TaxID=1559339 RepID=UPI000C0F09E9|nr:dienelactone hydrolase family protein [Chitinimonas sp. BJB300]PHV09962.1 hypothetical protein CSQ89_18765 [Chitinimonas sp. BJB300]